MKWCRFLAVYQTSAGFVAEVSSRSAICKSSLTALLVSGLPKLLLQPAASCVELMELAGLRGGDSWSSSVLRQ